MQSWMRFEFHGTEFEFGGNQYLGVLIFESQYIDHVDLIPVCSGSVESHNSRVLAYCNEHYSNQY